MSWRHCTSAGRRRQVSDERRTCVNPATAIAARQAVRVIGGVGVAGLVEQCRSSSDRSSPMALRLAESCSALRARGWIGWWAVGRYASDDECGLICGDQVAVPSRDGFGAYEQLDAA
jgi:hypothetical protein